MATIGHDRKNKKTMIPENEIVNALATISKGYIPSEWNLFERGINYIIAKNVLTGDRFYCENMNFANYKQV